MGWYGGISGGGGGMAIGGAVAGGTLGSVPFIGAGPTLAQDNANFFWDDTNKSLNLSGTPAVYKVPNVSGDNWFEGGAGNFTVTGTSNFGTGTGALASVTTGSNNVAVGAGAQALLLSGTGNFAVGTNALHNNDTGANNTAIGIQALGQLNGGSGNNVALGLQAGLACQGLNSLFIGTQAGLLSPNPNNDVFIGFQSGSSLTAGFGNTIVGGSSWFNATTGTNNTMLGHTVGNNIAGGNYNTIIGCWRGPSASITRVIALTDGTPTSVNVNLDYNYTHAQVWSFNYDLYWGNPVGIHIYNTQDAIPPTNYERACLDWNITSNVFRLASQAGGTGTVRLIAVDGFQKAGAPAAGDLPSGTFALIDDTSANQTWLCFNKAGTIRKVQLT